LFKNRGGFIVETRQRMMNRRNSERFAMNLRCYMRVGFEGSTMMAGTTENISRSGITVRMFLKGPAPTAPVPGDYCDLYLQLPQHPRCHNRCLYCRCAVAWTRTIGPEEVVVGVRVDVMDFRDLPPQAPRKQSIRDTTPGLLM
jgi:hypothetical protein